MRPVPLLRPIFFLVIAIFFPNAAAQSSRAASLELHARWNGTSYLSETAEFLVRNRFDHTCKDLVYRILLAMNMAGR